MASSKSPSALEPRFATLRCWEHEDCIDHPELGLVCATGQPTFCQVGRGGVWQEAFWWGDRLISGYINNDDPLQQDRRFDRVDADGYGDGYRYGCANGDGSGVYDDTYGVDGGNGRGDNYGYIQV